MSEYFAAIEAGGTKFDCAILDAERRILAERRIETVLPEETLAAVVAFFREQRDAGRMFKQLGLASFGPLDLNPASPTFGSVTVTPKPEWSHTPVKQMLEQALDCAVTIETDVNAAAIAEHRWGAARGVSVAVYITIGTGVGGGVVVNGEPVHGLIHPEIGHMLVPGFDEIKGACPFHGNCLEGLASGASMAKIWSMPATDLPLDHRAWDIEAKVLGAMCHNLMTVLSPERIILGGGVMNRTDLIPQIVAATEERLNNYLCLPKGKSLSDVIVGTGLEGRAGLFGAYALVR